MKRFSAMYEGKEMHLYANTPEELEVNGYTSIRPYENFDYMETINKIKETGEYIFKANAKKDCVREAYKMFSGAGSAVVIIAKDTNDDVYYDYVKWQVFKECSCCAPTLWDIGDCEKFEREFLNVQPIKYEVYSCRVWGEPKLQRPAELKGIKSFGKATFIDKKCNPQLFIKGDDVWIKHTDYFSQIMETEPKDIGTPLEYRARKYLGKNMPAKFIYADNWGSIVKRNEAWLVVRNLVSAVKRDQNYARIADKITKRQEETMGFEVATEWHRFWENVVKEVQNYGK